jgi:hypothetical protein
MTQAYNLSQLANNLTSAGLLDAADGLVNAVPIANGGTGATTASAARTNLGVAASAFSVPTGGIIMWSGSIASIPAGWFLCDGTNGTPNLTNRFVVMAGGSYAVGASGGSTDAIVVSHTHTATAGNQSANHVHTVNFNTSTASANHNHGIQNYNDLGFGTARDAISGNQVFNPAGSVVGTGFAPTASAGADHVHAVNGNTLGVSADHNHAITVNAQGASGTNANLPPYYALAYIMKS